MCQLLIVVIQIHVVKAQIVQTHGVQIVVFLVVIEGERNRQIVVLAVGIQIVQREVVVREVVADGIGVLVLRQQRRERFLLVLFGRIVLSMAVF